MNMLHFKKDGLVPAKIVKELNLPMYQRMVIKNSKDEEIPEGYRFLKKNEYGFPMYTDQPKELASYTELVRKGIKLTDEERSHPVAFYYKKGLRGYVPLYEFNPKISDTLPS